MEDDEEEGELKYDNGGNIIWEDNNGRPHRINGPAITYSDGDTFWMRHGKIHRDDGPARIWVSAGVEAWYKHGQPYEPSAHEIMVWKMKKKE